ncbi:hypothetical protein BLOT_006062 [Blomia tropicalis]|nr:hypothetical protein BLOT_006062 [Blomia tropicalis]
MSNYVYKMFNDSEPIITIIEWSVDCFSFSPLLFLPSIGTIHGTIDGTFTIKPSIAIQHLNLFSINNNNNKRYIHDDEPLFRHINS